MANRGNNYTPNDTQGNDELGISRISPWNNKDEFVHVYNLLFGEYTTKDTMQQACNFLSMWKIRRQQLTPASILSTLTILEVHLEDDPDCKDPHKLLALRKLYSQAFTRFLNYMSSILQTRYLKSMYSTAKELGLDSFMVDLRHLCAHGHELPELDVFQRSSSYLLDWLHNFYWKRELATIQDAKVDDVHDDRSLEYEKYLESLFHVYDTATEALHNSCRHLNDVKSNPPFDEETAKSLLAYGRYHQLIALPAIVSKITKELITVASEESKVRGNEEIFCYVLLKCHYLLSTAATYSNIDPTDDEIISKSADFVNQHQQFFRSLATCGFIETCFHLLIQICEDDHETLVRRQGAQFWANQIVSGFLIFKEVKNVFQQHKEMNVAIYVDCEPLNSNGLNEDIQKVYKGLGVNCNGILIFGDTIRRPWTLKFTHHYIKERMTAINDFTKDVIERCLSMVEPPLSTEQHSHLTKLLNAYVSSNADTESVSKMDEDIVYTVDTHLKQMIDTTQTEVDEDGQKAFGVWSEVSDEHNWKSVPIGRLPWE